MYDVRKAPGVTYCEIFVVLAFDISSYGGTAHKSATSLDPFPSLPLNCTMSAAQQTEKKGHICPPSDANHPADRWESLYVYSFICKFTILRSKVEGLETPME